jgi:hypothetical protein
VSRRDYVKCIAHTHEDLKAKTWCGKEIMPFDWVFQAIDHAAYSVLEGSRLVPCRSCVAKVKHAFRGSKVKAPLGDLPRMDTLKRPI